MTRLKSWLPDSFILALLATVAFATVLPATGRAAPVAAWASNIAIALLFFLHGARLSREAVLGGLRQPKLHALVLACTFVLFPLLGLALQAAVPGLVAPQLWTGVLFICTLSSTVQSSIAFTSIAKGNVPAAVCAATASNLLGIVATPVLVALLLHRQATTGSGTGFGSVLQIVVELLLPFVAGQALRPWIGDWAARNRKVLSLVDRGSILLAVYSAFGAAVVEGIWHLFPPLELGKLVLANAILLGLVLVLSTLAARLFGLKRVDEIVLVFCGSKKSLAAGIPMATVLFAGPTVGVVLLPIMIFHQMQLMVCAVLAKRYAREPLPQAAAVPAE
ncbi:MAG TPA: bile acid:sodium symporter family protein [Dongiaceae bacterium]|jgi:sodium/bile acid cotransporter 7|nr:bile acid:sodium symporter family protein [Dongiaceae bacterium]